MTTLDLLERAHAHLTELRDKATRGPWTYTETILGLHNLTILAGDEHVGYAGVGQFKDPTLVVTLHRTIDAQLGVLANAIHRWKYSDVPVSGEADLARAILNEQ